MASTVFYEGCKVDTDDERTACTNLDFAVDDEDCRDADSSDCSAIGGEWESVTCGIMVQSPAAMPNSSLCDMTGSGRQTLMMESMCCGGNPGAERCGAPPAMCAAGT